ncbi:MAG: diguanylate cyclase [Sulfurisoma sp.]|nr:diguanylate cyclase [Sulfurisoma sp.]
MTMHGISRSELQAMLDQLEQAISNHQKWHEFLARILVCRLPFDPRLASPNAHRECAFGAWYHGNASDKLRAYPAFGAMEAKHAEMHELASALLHGSAAGSVVDAGDYDHFTQQMAQFRLELQTLKAELETAVGNLDPLTGANNRIGMLTWLRNQQELVRRSVLPFSLAMIDLDHFKLVNDNHGHMAGDMVLMGVSRYLLDHIRPYDRLYRYGGEEFLLCMQGVDLGASHVLVDRLRDGLAGSPVTIDGGQISCNVSCGVAPVDPELPVETAIKRADEALYVAKARGRNRTQVWEPATK